MIFVEGNQKPSVAFALKDNDAAPIDISAETTTATFYFRQLNAHGAPKYGSITLSKTGDGTDGKVLLEWGETDLDTPGEYEAEIEIDYDGIRHTIPFLLHYTVRTKLDI